MNAPAVIRQKTIGELAREVLDDEGGMVAPAVLRLKSLIASDDALRESIAEAAINEYAQRRVANAMIGGRRAVWTAAERRIAAPAKTSVAALANGISASLLNFPLAGGLRLRDATRDQVSGQAQMYRAMGSDMLHKARWLALIAARLPDDETAVGAVLTTADVEAMQAEAANA